jgi:hypothetical protein
MLALSPLPTKQEAFIYQHVHDPTYDDEPDKPEFTGELSFEMNEWHEEFIHPDYEEGYDYG